MELPPLPVLDLNFAWFILIGLLLTGYAILDGFDLGVGMLHLFTKTDMERRLMMNSIGPLWDGNVVWLVTAGGALFAAFPNVFAAAFEGVLYSVLAAVGGVDFSARWQWSFLEGGDGMMA